MFLDWMEGKKRQNQLSNYDATVKFQSGVIKKKKKKNLNSGVIDILENKAKSIIW